MSLQNITFDTRDEYKRAQTADGIKKLLSNETLNITRLLINGEWGEGKTEFCHKLLNHFGDNYHLVYIDAFASDSVDNPLLTVTAEIAKLIPQGKTRTRFVKKALPACKVGLKTAGKAAVSWAFKQSTDSISDDFEKELQKGAEQLSDLAVESVLKEQIEAEKSISSLCAALELLTEGENGKPLIICVDEFDRCRPPYAISMLETIKHAFDQDKVHFIFCANKEILEQSIKHHYGVDDASRYLDKFIDLSIELPRSEQAAPGREFEFRRVSIQHLRSELEKYNLTQVSQLFTMSTGSPSFMLEILERVPTFTLRDAEKLARNIAILNEIQPINWDDDYYSCLTMLGIFAFTFYKADFENLEKAEYSQDLILKHFIDYTGIGDWVNDRSFKALMFTILMSNIKEHSQQRFYISKGELEDKVQRLDVSLIRFGDLDDLQEHAKIFSTTFRKMLNLS
ncbi:hypothetical protein QNF12_000141 [Vibrio alginolyticus]|uniref:KAP family P-loop NTPase fold protein n=1 Tax=Vibrio harveyi group TaxID=717610 RepID=UPI0006974409|nr:MULTISPECIES: P-loop NTPase fold protein [Vibrio harveyi group]EJG0880635.1 hypothetical protein [Vibrio parahaemolyticus]ELB2747331.1 hypothetical protein [Vibrio alginolyticus]MCS0082285.1 KAP family NTPase [Vibrio alginolyticus]